MKIILMEDVAKLGRRGEIREVATGYARNFLLPKHLAVLATPANLQNLESLKRQREQAENRTRQQAHVAAGQIEVLTMTVATRASDDGRLYGSVSSQDIVEFLAQQQISVEKRRVLLEEPIKTLGEFRISLRLHADVTAALTVNVVRE